MSLLRSVKNWLTLLFLALVGVAALTTWLYIVPSLQHRLVAQKLADGLRSTGLVSPAVQPYLSTHIDPQTHKYVLSVTEASNLIQVVNLLADKLSSRVVLIDAGSGARVADSRSGSSFVAGKYPMLSQAITTGVFKQGTVSINDSAFAVTAWPIPRENTKHVAAVVLISSPLTDVETAVNLVKRQILLATALALIVSLAAGYLAAHFIARRLKRIESSAEAIAGGDFNASVSVAIEDEIGQLGLTFNTMGERLRNAFTQIEREKTQVELLLNDLSEGVIGITEDGTVSISNPAAGELLGSELAEGAGLDRVFPEEVVRIWHDSRESGRDEDVVFEHGRRTLEAVTYPVGSGADFDSIIVLRDVSAQAKLERARRDFIANASHEFKTPLFSLSGFIELLDEGELTDAEREEFLQLMRQQVDRLRDLSMSLLDLSQVESGSLPIHLEPTDLVDVVASVVDEFQVQAATHMLSLALDHGPEPEIAWCDGQRLAQVVRALVDNAVKFTPQGGAVALRVDGDEQAAEIVVEDTGPGIASGDLAHIFERFYRGSDSRANKAGTGLGLSIARELVELMGGTLAVDSQPGLGARFSLRLPRSAPVRIKGEKAKGVPAGGPPWPGHVPASSPSPGPSSGAGDGSEPRPT
jgi:two-component system sensor histidine kinase VicK